MRRAAAGAAAAPVEVIRHGDQAKHLLKPARVRLLQQLAEPGSASSLARKLGLPRQRLNYHLRELEKQGFLELVEERRRGNCVERIVKATARSYLISPEALGALGGGPAAVKDRLSSSYLIAVAGRALSDLARLQETAAEKGKRLATLTLETEVRFASAEDRTAFAEALADAIARLSARYHDENTPGGRRFRFFVGGYPALPERGPETKPRTKEA